MNSFDWQTDGNVTLPGFDLKAVETWLSRVARLHGKLVGDLNYTFCNDDKIIEVNREFLNHDYYTDIITFDRSLRGVVRGDLFISLDTVLSNAINLGQDPKRELMRVVVHGLLHLCGINDKGPGEREIMEAEEEAALKELDGTDNFNYDFLFPVTNQ